MSGRLFDQFIAASPSSADDWLHITRRSEYGILDDKPLPYESHEWQALLDAIEEAQDRFVMFEVGAGYGRWTTYAVGLLRRYRPNLSYRLTAVEPEPTHYQWLRQHLRDNHVRRWRARTVNAAVSATNGPQDFYFGTPADWYGQALVRPENLGADAPITTVQTVKLSALLQHHKHIDLLDIDIQGAEVEAFQEARQELHRCRRILVETHFDWMHHQLREMLDTDGWRIIAGVPPGATSDTPLGESHFGNGGVLYAAA